MLYHFIKHKMLGFSLFIKILAILILINAFILSTNIYLMSVRNTLCQVTRVQSIRLAWFLLP